MKPICEKCWHTPCTCGESFKDLNDDQLLILIDNLTKLAKDRNININATVNRESIYGYLLNKNHGVVLTNDTFNDIVAKSHYTLPQCHREWIMRFDTLDDAWKVLKREYHLRFRTLLALLMLTCDLEWHANKLAKFVVHICASYTQTYFGVEPNISVWQNNADELAKSLHEAYIHWQQTLQIYKDNNDVSKLDPILAQSAAFFKRGLILLTDDNIEVKLRTLLELVEILAIGIQHVDQVDNWIKFRNKPFVTLTDYIDRMSRQEYGLLELDDEDLFDILCQEYPEPHFNNLRIK